MQRNTRNTREDKLMTVEEILIFMKKFFEGIKEEQQKLIEELETKQAEQEDLLHEIELSKLNAAEIAKVVKTLKEVRVNRRIIKNDLERVKLIKNFTDKYNNKFITNDISMLLGELRKLNKIQNNRKYQPRVFENLKCGGKR